MTPDPLDELLAQAARRSPHPAALKASIDRARQAIVPGLQPVHPMAGSRRYGLLFLMIFAIMAVVSGLILGPHGIVALSQLQRLVIFPALLISACAAALACARTMRPGTGPSFAGLTAILSCAALPLLFSLLFRSYSTLNLVKEGLPCLIAGMCVSIPTGVLLFLLMRHGFVLEWRKAGVVCGTLAGLAGLAMLEIHCANLKAIHVIVWHGAVVLLSALVGWVLARIAS